MPIVTYFISYVWRTVRTILRSVEHCKYTHFSMYSCIEGHHKDEEEKKLANVSVCLAFTLLSVGAQRGSMNGWMDG